MPLTKLTQSVDRVQTLSDRPNALDGLDAAQLKAKFDEAGNIIKDYLNNVLIPELDAGNSAIIADYVSKIELTNNRKLSLTGNFTGSWHGIANPTMADPGIANMVNAINQARYGMDANAVINGGFAINQRVKTGVVTLTAGEYGHDRWKAGPVGCTYTFTTSNGVTTVTITAGSLVQVIEGALLSSGSYVLSWTGTAKGRIGSNSYGDSSITVLTTGGTNLNIEFSTGTVSQVVFNRGTTPLPYQPRTFAEELNFCMRYYQKSYTYSVQAGSTVNASIGAEWRYATSEVNFYDAVIKFPTIMRVSPTVKLYGYSTGNEGKWNEIYTSVDTTVSFGYQSEKSFTITGASMTKDKRYVGHWIADAEL